MVKFQVFREWLTSFEKCILFRELCPQGRIFISLGVPELLPPPQSWAKSAQCWDEPPPSLPMIIRKGVKSEEKSGFIMILMVP